MISKAWRWLLGRPEPAQPMRRIVSAGIFAAVFITLSIATSSPGARHVIMSLLWLAIFACCAGIIALLAAARRRRRR
jgi:hypothetical protein